MAAGCLQVANDQRRMAAGYLQVANDQRRMAAGSNLLNNIKNTYNCVIVLTRPN
jgi:hypothetical protein